MMRANSTWAWRYDGNLTRMRLVKELEPHVPVFWDCPAACNPADELRIAQEHGFERLVIEQTGITAERMRQFPAWGINRLYTDDPRMLIGLVAAPWPAQQGGNRQEEAAVSAHEREDVLSFASKRCHVGMNAATPRAFTGKIQ